MHKLLLADDSVTIQRVIELTFSGEDVQVLAVNDGEQAIARIPIERPDVVLADIGMPRKGGYDVAAFVKGRPDLAHIPVLLLAGAFEPVDQARAEQVRADGVLIKPFEPRQVIERVKELLALVREAPAREPIVAVPVPLPVASAAAPADTASTQSLDELLESLNQALSEPARASRVTPMPAAAPPPLPEPAPAPLVAILPAVREPLLLEPAVPFAPLAAASSNGATLDDYFERLSAAFEDSIGPARVFQPMPDRLEDLVPSAGLPPSSKAGTWPGEEWLSPAVSARRFDHAGENPNPILEAVTALMAQDQRNGTERPEAPARVDVAVVTTASPPASPEMVDVVIERVLARLVPEVAESLRRLVRQEIARAQRHAR